MKQEIKLPEWLEHRYLILWEALRDSSFQLEDAVKILEEKKKNHVEQVPVFLSELKKAGWLEVKLDPNDARKRIYTLKKPFAIIKGALSKGEVESLLKKAADLIRTRVDYKFILVLLFLKRMSDKWEKEYENAYKEALEDGLSEKDAELEAKNSAYHEFNLPEEFLWENIRKGVGELPERFSKALKSLSEEHPDLKVIFDNIDFVQFTSNRENAEILRQLVELFSEKKLHDVSSDILGDAYEWILRYFAPTKAKEGEIFTPREVIKLLVEILEPKPEESIYDPACGSGGMLITSYKYVEENFGRKEANKLFLFGQEYNPSIIALAKMNMFMHDIRDSRLDFGDSLLYPRFKEGGKPKEFDIVIANPSWNQDGYDEATLKKGEFWNTRFKYGFAPRQSADWVWIQHMVASAKDDVGRVGIVIDNGCLFRGGKEKVIRAQILEEKEDLIECVILLPEKLFYNTGAPGVIIILKKNKPNERKKKVLFINATKEFEQHSEVRKLNRLGDKHIKKITKAYKEFTDEPGFSKVVSLDEIKENDYNLNVTLYVFPEEESEEIDVEKEWRELREVELEIKEIEGRINKYLEELKESERERALSEY